MTTNQDRAAMIDTALKKHEMNCCMFERGVQTLDDLLASREVLLAALQSQRADCGCADQRDCAGECCKQAAAEPGDIRALKHRIHELEGEVIGYKRILDEQDAAVPVKGSMTDKEIADHVRAQGFNPEGGYELDDMVRLIKKLRSKRPGDFFATLVIKEGLGAVFEGIPAGTAFAPGDTFRMYKEAA